MSNQDHIQDEGQDQCQGESQKNKSSVQELQFNNYLVNFIQQLKKVVPTEKKLFTKYYKYYRGLVDQGKRLDFIVEFIRYLSKYHKEFSTCDEGLFSEEQEYYPSKPIQLMKGIDFKEIWRSEELNDESKQSIWKYLQTLYLIGSSILREKEEYNKLTKQQNELFTKLLASMKCETRIKREAEKQEQEENTGQEDGGLDFSELFEGDNVITQLAQEVVKEIGADRDQLTTLRTLFSQDNTKLQEIINKISQKLTTVLHEKSVSDKDLLEQAQSLYKKLLGKFKGIPGMPDLEVLSKRLADELGKNMATSAGTGSETEQSPEVKSPEVISPTVTVDDLTNNIKKHFSEMGLGNVDEIQRLMNQFVMGEAVTSAPPPTPATTPVSVHAPVHAPVPAPAPVPVQKDSSKPADDSDDFDRELAKLKKKVSKK